MKWTLRILGGFVLLVVVLVVGLFAVARIHDGPLEGGLAIVAAGAFKSGDLQSDPEERIGHSCGTIPRWSSSCWTRYAHGPRGSWSTKVGSSFLPAI